METVRSFYQNDNNHELIYKDSPFQKMLEFFEEAGFNQTGSPGLGFAIYPALLITKWVLQEWDKETLNTEQTEDRLKIYSSKNPMQYVIFQQDVDQWKLYGLSKELCGQIVQNWKMQFV